MNTEGNSNKTQKRVSTTPKRKPRKKPKRKRNEKISTVFDIEALKAQHKALTLAPDENGLRIIAQRKQVFLAALMKHMGNVTEACKETGIPRRTHYAWTESDEEYALVLSELKEMSLDFYEAHLKKLVKKGNAYATVWALKTLGKGRGYIETVHNVNQNFDGNNVHHFFLPHNGRENVQDAQVITE